MVVKSFLYAIFLFLQLAKYGYLSSCLLLQMAKVDENLGQIKYTYFVK